MTFIGNNHAKEVQILRSYGDAYDCVINVPQVGNITITSAAVECLAKKIEEAKNTNVPYDKWRLP